MLRMRVLMVLACLLAGLATPATAQSSPGLAGELARGDALVDRLSLADHLGPLAPVALSPFFGLACLSGAALLVEQGVLPDHPMLSDHAMLTRPGLFAALVILTLVTSLPRLTKVGKPLAQLADFLESYAGFVVLLLAWQFGGGGDGAPTASAPIMLAAGLGADLGGLLLAAAAFANFFVIQTVRLFFEFLVFLTPVPLIDALFEALNKAFTLALIALYVFNPYAALVANLLLFAGCAMLFRWTHRRVVYYRHLVLYPAAMRIASFFRRAPTGTSPDQRPARPPIVFPLKRIGTIKPYAKCRWLREGDGASLAYRPMFGSMRTEAISPAAWSRAVWDRDVFGALLRLQDDGTERPLRVKARDREWLTPPGHPAAGSSSTVQPGSEG